jgi:hypothetical protein
MRSRILQAGMLCILAAILAAALPGCGQSEPAATLPEPEYAGAATEITLQGLSENDLEKYTRYGNEDFKAAVTRQVLDAAAAQIGGKLGAYQSKAFSYAEEKEGFVIVHYKAKYTNGEVGVRMVFDEDNLVAGQWFE